MPASVPVAGLFERLPARLIAGWVRWMSETEMVGNEPAAWVGLLLAGLFAALAMDRGSCPAQMPVMMIAVAIAVAAALLVALKRR